MSAGADEVTDKLSVPLRAMGFSYNSQYSDRKSYPTYTSYKATLALNPGSGGCIAYPLEPVCTVVVA